MGSVCIQSSSEFLKATWEKDEEATLIVSLPFQPMPGRKEWDQKKSQGKR